LKFKVPHPVVWITAHPAARVVGLTIGHDGRVHDLPAFKTLLTNAVQWAAKK
jgi:type 1 glutamine amidotransferase